MSPSFCFLHPKATERAFFSYNRKMWFSWFRKEATARVGAIVDVSDSKIEVALVYSDISKSVPEVIWTHAEILSSQGNAKSMNVLKKAIFNAFSALSKDGVRILNERKLPNEISLIQATLHAPYSHTITRSVSVTANRPVKVTRSLVEELEQKANADAYKMQYSELSRFGVTLYPLSSAAVALRLNGYQTKYPYKSMAEEITLSQHVSFATFDFRSMLVEARDKYLPKVVFDTDSFISLFYRTVMATSAKTSDCSLLTIGDSATEFITVRDGLPQHSSFMPFGLNSISAKISGATGLLPHEARAVTKKNRVDNIAPGVDRHKKALSVSTADFEVELKKLLSKTGDVLALPRTIYLQNECDHEAFFTSMVLRVAKDVTGTKHSVHSITSEFFSCQGVRDASILSLAYAFHKKLYEDDYLDL